MKQRAIILFLLFDVILTWQGWSQPMKEQAKAAFEYLNKVRENPSKYSKEIGADLSKVKPRAALIWNDTLARVAEAKALDMGKRNYFGHVNPEGRGINIMIHEAGYDLPPEWIKDKQANFFESINAGTETGTGAIRDLILDSYDKEKGHRKHLLGTNEFYSTLTHIGIGHVKVEGSKYIYYTVVIIAKQR
jgi:uncharacterized protein YkwD